jgi:hypothetical protein
MQVGSGKPLPFAISLSNFSFPWKTKKKKFIHQKWESHFSKQLPYKIRHENFKEHKAFLPIGNFIY